MADSNPQPRRWCSELVRLQFGLDNGWGLAVAGNLEEIGESSAVVLTDTRIRPGTSVVISRKKRDLKGIVHSCNADEPLGFFVEIRFEEKIRWTHRWWAPQHLLPDFKTPA